jgi:hypothetical protein
MIRITLIASGLCLGVVSPAFAQLAPEVGYVFPAGGKAGTTVDVHFGGFDWTPDMQFFTHDPRVKLEVLGPPGPLLIPPPPYWFGARGRLAALPLAKEVPARLTLPADLPPGPIRWQVANANGASSTGLFFVGSGRELIEDERRREPTLLPELPVTVSGRLLKNEEIDRYRFTAPRGGLMTIELMARRLGSNFHGALEVRDAAGRLLLEEINAEGEDPVLTFATTAGQEYVLSIRDIDHAGDRAYVYRLTLTPGPRVLAALPTAGKRGETREVQFVGIGVATGKPQIERVTRKVAFPSEGESFRYQLETPFGTAPPHEMLLSDQDEALKPDVDDPRARRLVSPAQVTAILTSEEDRYTFAAKRGEVVRIEAIARRIGSPLDVALAIRNPEGKELARADDLPSTTDAQLDFTAPADGTFQIIVTDQAGMSGSPTSFYRLLLRPLTDDFELSAAAQRLAIPLGTKGTLTIKASRTGAFKGPIALTLSGLPAGVSAPPNLEIPADKAELAIVLDVPADAAALAGLVTVTGQAAVNGVAVTRTAVAPTSGSLAPRAIAENRTDRLCVVTTLKPRVKAQPVDKDTGRKVPRGSTHPAEILLERLEGYTGEVLLTQGSKQSYQVQGIRGRDVIVPPGVDRPHFPCYVPEWLETSRTSRIGLTAMVRIADPKGNLRWTVAPVQGFVTMHMEGALLKLSHHGRELSARAGETMKIRVKIARAAKLVEPVQLELIVPDEWSGLLKGEPINVPAGTDEVEFPVQFAADPRLKGEVSFGIRGTAIQPGDLPVISETTVPVLMEK